MQENYRTGMVDPATRVDEYVEHYAPRHRRNPGGKHRRKVPCGVCNGAGRWRSLTCQGCAGSGLVPMAPRMDDSHYAGTHRADGPAK